MNKYNKAISFILLVMLVVTFNSGISFADTNITYDNSKNLIEKLSHSTSGEGAADGILPANGGDRANSYTWTQAQLGDYVYLGSNRNLLASTFLQVAGSKLDEGLTLKFLDDISEGDIPTDNIDDRSARMFRYNTNSKTFEEIYKNPAYTGYRGALTYKPEGAEKASVYFGSLGLTSQVLRFGEDFKTGDTPDVVYSALPGYASIRAMTEHKGTMCIGVLTIASDGDSVYKIDSDVTAPAVKGNLQIFQTTNPAIGAWKEIASIEDFAPCNPRTDAGAAAQSGVWDMISYNGSIYAFIGTGYVNGSETNGYSVFKGTYLPEDENANKEGWVWKMIVGPLEDANGDPTGAIYPRGMGNQYDGSASPFLYTDPNGKTYVYVGTFDSIFESIFEILSKYSYESLYRSMHPAKIYRFDENDKWDMVIGNPDEYFNTKLGNYYAGFSTSTALSVYSPNLYVWRMAQYNGELFAGTFDGTTLMDMIVPPLKIDLENYDNHDLVTILNMCEKFLPPSVLKKLTDAVNYVDDTSAAAIKAKEVSKHAEEAAAAGDAALAAAEETCAGTISYIPGQAISSENDLYGLLSNCKSKTDDFAAKVSAAAVKATAPAIIPYAAASAASSQTAAKSASAAVASWTDVYSNMIQGNIYNVRDDVSAAAIDAHEFSDQAKAEAAKALQKAQDAETAISGPKQDVIDFNKDLNKLLTEFNVNDYENFLNVVNHFTKSYDTDNSDDRKAFQELKYVVSLRLMININKEADKMGCSVYRTSDGLNFTPITEDGFGDKYNYGLRTFLSTSKGLFMGMANPFYGAQLWRLGDLPSSGGSGSGGGGHGSSGSGTTTITESAIPLGAVTLAALNMKDHYAYIQGYEDGTIRPLNSMTRAEVATIFYRLFTDDARAQYQTKNNSFRDVSASDWFNTAVSTLVNAGVLTGYSDGTFHPDASITRAEFATILSKFTDENSESSKFTDISSHWARDSINTAYADGWITGYSDDTFRPNQVVSRAEVMTMINRLLQRVVKASDMLDGMTTWSDNPKGTWYYEVVQEATNSHNHELTKELVPGQTFYYEKWTKLTSNPY